MNLTTLEVAGVRLVRDEAGQIFATSLDVAERFGKHHKNVLRAIDALECSVEFRRLNFEPSSYINEQGKEQPCYRMTRDGFTLLAMGFTGAEATRWKESYIRAFNMMEREVTQRQEIDTQVILDVINARHDRSDALQRDVAMQVFNVETKVVSVESVVREHGEQISLIQRELGKRRRGILQETKNEHVQAVLRFYHGKCPICAITKVVDDEGQRIPPAEFDHFMANHRPDVGATWLICQPCHREITHSDRSRLDATPDFQSYQRKRKSVQHSLDLE